MRVWVEDAGESERRPVIGWIPLEASADIRGRESGQTSCGSYVVR